MAVTVKRIQLWRREVDNRPGVLARALRPLAASGADLQVVMAYRFPGDESRGAIELYPISGKKASAAAQSAGFAAADIPAVIVEGDNRAGIGAAMTAAVAEAGINLAFVVTQVVGRKYSAIFGFDQEADAKKATPLLKKAGGKR